MGTPPPLTAEKKKSFSSTLTINFLENTLKIPIAENTFQLRMNLQQNNCLATTFFVPRAVLAMVFLTVIRLNLYQYFPKIEVIQKKYDFLK